MTTGTPPGRTDDLSAPPTIREQVTDYARKLLVLAEADSNLVAHARRELAIIGEDEDTIAGIVHVVAAFAACGHSGGSAPYAIAYLERLLRFQPLSPLTSDPDEWHDHSDISSGPLWQSERNSEAFSTDAGKTYYLLSERQAAGSMETTPLHTAQEPRAEVAR